MGIIQTKQLWRSRIERLLETDMSVMEWCRANKVSDSSMFRWIGIFAESEPELFGGAQNIADRADRQWITRTRENMRASAPIVPAGGPGCGFVRIDVTQLADASAPAPRERPCPDSITVSIGPAVVSVPAGSDARDVALVLEAVSRL